MADIVPLQTSIVTYDERLRQQAEKAVALQGSSSCPYCQAPLTKIEILSLHQGSGYVRFVLIELRDGTRKTMKSGEVNLQTMLVVEA